MDKVKVEDLRWVRAFSPDVIPRDLVEQVKQRNYSVDDFFKFQEGACLRSTKEGPTLNPLSHLWVLANPKNLTKGFLWFTVDPLTKDMVIQTYSVDKEYWSSGGSVKKLADHVKYIREKANLNKIYWISTYEKHAQRHGFHRSKSILMEYDPSQQKKEDKLHVKPEEAERKEN